MSKCCTLQVHSRSLVTNGQTRGRQSEGRSNLDEGLARRRTVTPRFKEHRQALLEMLEEFESLWYRRLRLINIVRHQIELLNDEIRLVHSALYRAGPTARKFAAAEIDQMITQNVNEPV